MWWIISLLACGESVTFEEAPVEPVAEPAEVPAKDDLPVVVPTDARPDEVVVQQDGDPNPNGAPAAAPGSPPPAGQPWPPIIIPQEAREREWKWDFEATTGSKKPKPEAKGYVATEKEVDDANALEDQ